MKEHYNFEFNPPEPSDEQIRSHMDFEALLQQVDHKPVEEDPVEKKPRTARRISLRRPAYIGTAIAATLVGVVAFSQFFNHSNTDNYKSLAFTHFQEQPFINPPFEQAQAQLVHYNLDADMGGNIKINENSNINVPPSAFLDADGNAITGNVNIKYRNLDDPSEYFMSGIPMYYDSLGSTYDFEASQLFEIYAEKDGKALSINPKKGMEISFSGMEMSGNDKVKPNSLGIYQLDVNQEKWNYKGQSNASFKTVNQPLDRGAMKQQIESEYESSLAALEQKLQADLRLIESGSQVATLPQKPKRYDPNVVVFDLDFNFETSSENANYQNLKWQPIGDEKTLNMLSSIEWFEDEIKLSEGTDGLFSISFDNGEISAEVEAIPVLSGDEFQAAIAAYETKVQEIKTAQENSNKDKDAAIEKLKQQFETDKNAEAAKKQERLAKLNTSNNASQQIVERAVAHVFTIHQLGIWNCDKVTAAKIKKTKVTCTSNSGKTYEETTLFVADLNRNSLTKYYLGKFAEINIDPSSKNQIWLITSEGKLAVAYPNKLKNNIFSQPSNEIILQPIDRNITSEKDVYGILQLGSPM